MRFFGNTIRETNQVFGKPSRGSATAGKKDKIECIARIVVSFVIIAVAVTFILLHEAADIAHIMLGAVIGYWLK
jgi:hypothetical protein